MYINVKRRHDILKIFVSTEFVWVSNVSLTIQRIRNEGGDRKKESL